MQIRHALACFPTCSLSVPDVQLIMQKCAMCLLQAARLREILTTLGPAFVKIGQVWHTLLALGFPAGNKVLWGPWGPPHTPHTHGWAAALDQAVSSRPDVAPPSFVLELEKLQDQIPPFPTAEAMAVMTEDLGMPPSAVFSYLSPEPVAAASLGQVRASDRDLFQYFVAVKRPEADWRSCKPFKYWAIAYTAWVAVSPNCQQARSACRSA